MLEVNLTAEVELAKIIGLEVSAFSGHMGSRRNWKRIL